MKYIKKFEKYTPLAYKKSIREIINIIKKYVGDINEYTEKILDLMATNNNLYFKHGKSITDIEYFFNNFNDFIFIVTQSEARGSLGEISVKYLLEKKYNLIVQEVTKDEDISGIDLISIGKSKILHQVKTIYNYIDHNNYIEIKNKSIQIKTTDKYDYLWFFSTDNNECVLLKKSDIKIISTTYGYNIYYTKIKKIKIPEIKIEEFKKIIIQDINNKIDNKIKNLDSVDLYSIKYNL